VVGGCFLAFARGEQGPGQAGDRGWAGGALVAEPDHGLVAAVAVPVRAGAGYEPGRLALREGAGLAAAVSALSAAPDVLLVDATGRDHPRRAGLALHLGAVLDLPSIGVTHRPLRATGELPPDEPGASTTLVLEGEVVGAWLRTRPGTRPVAVHAAWRTDATTAIEVVLRCTGPARTPEPLRQARVAARRARADAEGRTARQ
jgi:deoxyribonuclease V